MVTEIGDQTWRLESELGGRYVYQYLLASDDGRELALVDTGTSATPREVVLPSLRRLGLSPAGMRLVVVTHPDVDHQGGLAALREICPRAALTCGFYDQAMVGRPEQLLTDRYQTYMREHRLGYGKHDVAWIRASYGAPVELDATFSGGELLSFGDRQLEVHHAPGHSAGHLVLLERSRGVLFSSDALHRNGCPGTDGGNAMCPTYEEVDAYVASIELVRSLAPLEMHSGHWSPCSGPALERFLDDSRSFVELVDAILLNRLQEPATLVELCRAVEREAGPWDSALQLLMFCVHGHLRRLQRRGCVRPEHATTIPRRYVLAAEPGAEAARPA